MATIVFDQYGKVEFTRKPELLALFEGEHKSIVRMTEVEWNDDYQSFIVVFKTGPLAGLTLTAPLMYTYEGTADCTEFSWLIGETRTMPANSDEVLHFRSYEDGVRAELLMVEAIRATGTSMHV